MKLDRYFVVRALGYRRKWIFTNGTVCAPFRPDNTIRLTDEGYMRCEWWFDTKVAADEFFSELRRDGFEYPRNENEPA